MKKLVYLAVILSAAFLTSCSVNKKFVPRACNTINTVRFDELNLKRNDYTILKNVTAEAVVVYETGLFGGSISISEQNNEFSIEFRKSGKDQWVANKFNGIAYFGYLSNDYGDMALNLDPDYYSRHIAFYRLINQCRVAGGDALIEPTVSTNVEEQGRKIVFKTTVTAKVVKINTDK
ncbi:MAG: hypothetical protein MJZ56_07580 [Bacteroidales bacterium]|nr:hypothetical protein [Bacteroidales bacterium]